MGNLKNIYSSFCSFCQFANFNISFCQQNGQNEKIDKDIFHSAHSASLLPLPFHSASRIGRMGNLIKHIFHSAHSAILLTLPFHSVEVEWAEWENRQTFAILLILPVC